MLPSRFCIINASFKLNSLTTLALMLVSYFFLPGPTPDAGLTPVNVDYVYGLSDSAPQSWMPGWAWLALMMAGLPTALFTPMHFAMMRWRPVKERAC